MALRQCPNCGAGLESVPPWQEEAASFVPEQAGPVDLAESRLRWRGDTCLTILMLALASLFCAGGGAQLVTWLRSNAAAPPPATRQPAVLATLPATSTARPTRFLPTVTVTPPPPPTATWTPSPAPCLQEVRSGDSLIELVARCGHRDLEVLELVLERNGLAAAELLQVGQQLDIPWPTTTAAADTAPAGAPVARDSAAPASRLGGLPSRATPTLQAGVQWHRVNPGETMVGVAFRYGTDLKVLSELNPEVTFSQCDFGQASGGPSCSVTVYENQRLRVPAPTATATLPPTPSGIATATPTAVINRPAAYSPSDNHNFASEELVTLRWVASGTLKAGEVWRVSVESLSGGQVYTETTTALSLVIPAAWKEPEAGWHGYRWRVQLDRGQAGNGERPETVPRTFLWETRP